MPGTGQDTSAQNVPPEQAERADLGRPDPPYGVETDPSGVAAKLIDMAERSIGHVGVAREAIMDEIERRNARDEWQEPAEGEEARDEPRSARTAQASGGAMPIRTGSKPFPRRPFTGFDRERATFARVCPKLLTHQEGKYIAIVGDEYSSICDSHEEAERDGYATFGLGPLYIKQILASEPVALITRLVAP